MIGWNIGYDIKYFISFNDVEVLLISDFVAIQYLV